jgi:hypothetical protein
VHLIDALTLEKWLLAPIGQETGLSSEPVQASRGEEIALPEIGIVLGISLQAKQLSGCE